MAAEVPSQVSNRSPRQSAVPARARDDGEDGGERLENLKREFPFERRHFDFISRLLHQLAGIHLPPHKLEMMYSRLGRRLRQLNLKDFDAYCALVDSAEGIDEVSFLVNALTTNLTSFFREPHHFHHLAQTVLPAVRQQQTNVAKPRLRVWSAGCSSGPEPYTIAMVMASTLTDLRRWDARILATDIDTHMVDTARSGVYPADYGDGIPTGLKERFTRRDHGADGDPAMVMGDDLRRLIAFKPLNLLEDWPMKGPFDAIFCRNVLIYFDRAGRTHVIDKFTNLLAPNGFLYLGHSESLFGISDRFEQAGPTIYRRLR
ncbi:chemotaxis protein methyltransferase [uncultured Gammaproteobacteria bacterium]